MAARLTFVVVFGLGLVMAAAVAAPFDLLQHVVAVLRAAGGS